MANNSTSVTNHAQCLPETYSRCVTGSVTAAHNFEVSDFSLLVGMGIGKYVSSSTFSVGGYDWNIRFYPDGSKEEDKAAYVSAHLCFCNGATGVRVNFSLSLLHKGDQVSILLNTTHTFESVGGIFGWPKFVEKSRLRPFPYLNNGCFTIRCVLTVIKEHHTEDVSTVVVPQSDLLKHFEHMLKDGEGVDVTFSVGGQLFRAHRCVLAARSPVFKAELFGAMKEKAAQCIKIDDMEPMIFKTVLHFIYTDTLPENCDLGKTVAMQHLLVAADRYGLDRLRVMCEGKLCQSIDVQTVATTLALAEQHHCVQLKNACLGFMASGDVLGVVMETGGFKHLVASCPLVMEEILDKVSNLTKNLVERDRA